MVLRVCPVWSGWLKCAIASEESLLWPQSLGHLGPGLMDSQAQEVYL